MPVPIAAYNYIYYSRFKKYSPHLYENSCLFFIRHKKRIMQTVSLHDETEPGKLRDKRKNCPGTGAVFV